MIRVVYAILTVVIKDLEVRLINSNLQTKKSAIRFELLTQKQEVDKQTTDILYYKY